MINLNLKRMYLACCLVPAWQLTSQEEILPERIIGARNLCRATHLPLREHRETIKFETGIAEPENREK